MKEATLKKYFSDEELEFIKNYAKQNGITESDAIFKLARDMIQSYNLKFVSGQQVLTMIDLLAMKIPQWIGFMISLIGQSSIQVSTLSRQLASLTQPTPLDRIIDLIRTPEAKEFFSNLLPIIASIATGGKFNQSNLQNNPEEGWL